MNRLRCLQFDSLEVRTLQSRAHVSPHHAHVSPHHARPAVAASPLVLSGTLTVDNNASTTSEDDEGDVTTSTPVAGQLGSLGEVHGIWNESSDAYGDYLGPDTIQLRSSTGTFMVQFNAQASAAAHHRTGGVIEYSDPQLVSGGTGAYSRAKETGTIELATNATHAVIETMTLSTKSK